MTDTIDTIIQAYLGTYTPNTYTIGTDTVIASGLAGVDWVYLGKLALLLVVLYSIWRIIGGIACRK